MGRPGRTHPNSGRGRCLPSIRSPSASPAPAEADNRECLQELPVERAGWHKRGGDDAPSRERGRGDREELPHNFLQRHSTLRLRIELIGAALINDNMNQPNISVWLISSKFAYNGSQL